MTEKTGLSTLVGKLILLVCLPVSVVVNAQLPLPSILFLLLDEPECASQSLMLSDDFECDRVFLQGSPWTFVNSQGVVASVMGGELIFELTEQLLWFNNNRGVLMHRNVSGDFKATTTLRVHQTSDSNLLPNGPVQLAGLMARNPESDMGEENYVFIVLGFDVNDVSIETKNTINGVSDFEGPSWTGGRAELRICRIGDNFYTYKRLNSDDSWIIADGPAGIDWPMIRPDLPDTLQVGLNIYTSTVGFDITARFESIDVQAVADLAGCIVD